MPRDSAAASAAASAARATGSSRQQIFCLQAPTAEYVLFIEKVQAHSLGKLEVFVLWRHTVVATVERPPEVDLDLAIELIAQKAKAFAVMGGMFVTSTSSRDLQL